MRVRLLQQIAGTRDGVRWPAPDATLDLPQSEALDLVAVGAAVPVAHPEGEVEVETASVEDDSEKRLTRKK